MHNNNLIINADGDLVDVSSISGSIYGISLDRSNELIGMMDNLYLRYHLSVLRGETIQVKDIYDRYIIPLDVTADERFFVHMLFGTLILRLQSL